MPVKNDVGIIASRKAWWRLGTIAFNLMCKEFSISVPAGASFFTMVFAMVKHFLAIRAEDCLQIVRQRLQDPLSHETTCDALHEIEEAVHIHRVPTVRILFDGGGTVSESADCTRLHPAELEKLFVHDPDELNLILRHLAPDFI